MINAKEEFIGLTNIVNIKYAIVYNDTMFDESNGQLNITLPINHTPEQYNEFLNKLDFNYDDGYGSQYLFGDIWLTDGTWYDRGEYDGSKWWKHQSCPDIPDELKEDDHFDELFEQNNSLIH